jgi:hypothetical protein
VLMNDNNWPPPGAPSVSISSPPTGPWSVVETNDGTTSLAFTISLSAPFDRTITVDYSTADGAAVAGSDYVAKSGTATFLMGETSQTIDVLVMGDRLAEWDEYFLVTLSNPSNARMGTSQAVGYIEDDEPRISISDVWLAEGNSGTTAATFIVSLARIYDQDVTVNFSTVEGDTEAWYGWGYYGYYYPPPAATAGTDFQAQTGQVTIPAGELSQEVTVVVNGDHDAEDYEYFSVDLADASANAIISDGHGLGAIVDDEPRFSISQAYSDNWENLAYKYEGNTGTTTFRFAVTMSSAYDVPVSVSFNTVDGTAIAGSDYQAQSGTLTFNPGAPLTQYIEVVVDSDRVAESDEYFYVNLTNPTAGGVDYSQTYGYILNDEPNMSIGDVYQNEANSGTTEFTFSVWLSSAYDVPVTVNWTTANGSATAGSDFVAASGTLTFAPGETTQTISVAVVGDEVSEANEAFTVNLSNASGALIVRAAGSGTIVNDDINVPRISITDVRRNEGRKNSTTFTFTVTLTAPSAVPVKVNYATADGTARTGDGDYVAAGGTLTFAAGETSKTITIKVKGDRRLEADETFVVNLSGAINASILDGQGLGTIVNDDSTSFNDD